MKDGHGGVTVGSEISGGVRNVFAENCRMDSPHLDIAVRIKNNAMRGGLLENIYARNIDVGQVALAIPAVGQNCIVAGIVTDVAHNRPMERARVTLFGPRSLKTAFTTGADGPRPRCIRDEDLRDIKLSPLEQHSHRGAGKSDVAIRRHDVICGAAQNAIKRPIDRPLRARSAAIALTFYPVAENLTKTQTKCHCGLVPGRGLAYCLSYRRTRRSPGRTAALEVKGDQQ